MTLHTKYGMLIAGEDVIPEFNKDGYLPKGIHKTNLKVLEKRFGRGSTRRKELFNAHMLFAMKEDPIEYQRIIDFFGHDRDGKSKGLVEVIL